MPAVVEPMSSIPLGAMDSTAPSSADNKKRNKLGYHRTSVACVHCRRRKIRCLVAADDAQGRCENCIRLRKECQFFPVDQQPPIEKKTRPSSRLDNASTSTASSSPPIISGPLEHASQPRAPPQPQSQPQPQPQPETFLSYQPISLSAGQDISGIPAPGLYPGAVASPFAPDASMTPEFAAPTSLDPSVPWDEFTTISDPQMLATMNAAKQPPTMMDMNPNAWAPEPISVPPMPTNTLHAPTLPSQSQPQTLSTTTTTHSTAPTFTMQPDGSVWQVPPPPTRSMTFPVQQEMPTSYSNQFASLDPTPKREITSPNPQSFPGTPVHQQGSPVPDPMQTMPMSMSYPGQQQSTTMGYPMWPDTAGLGLNVMQYPMYAGDPSQQGSPFGSPPPPPPMGHPGTGHSPQP